MKRDSIPNAGFKRGGWKTRPDRQRVERLGYLMVKFPSLVSRTLGVSTLLTRIRAWVVAGLVTFQLSAPVLAVLLASAFQVAPPSRESSIRTLPLTPVG